MASELVNLKKVDKRVHISSDLEQHAAWLQDDIDMGFQQLMLHNVNLEQEGFIDDFGQHVPPLS